MSPKKDDGNHCTAKAAITRIADVSGISRSEIGRRLGHATNYIPMIFSKQSDVSAMTLAKIARVCGYQLMLVNDDADDVIILDDGESS